MLINLLQRHHLWIFLFLSGLCGVALGHLVATGTGILAGPTYTQTKTLQSTPKTTKISIPLADYQIILERDIFNSAGGAQTLDKAAPLQAENSTPPKAASKWQLIGTISGGDSPLAALSSAGKTTSYHLNDELPDGGAITRIERNRVELSYPGNKTQILEFAKDKTSPSPPAAQQQRKTSSNSNLGIKDLGENRWHIPAQVAENTRSNVGDLLRQAQAIPYLEGKKTTGFQIRMIQRGSLIEQIGLRKGDILREVNGVKLDSPEKALQIFGQLRQAKQISIGLERRGKAMTFAYEIR